MTCMLSVAPDFSEFISGMNKLGIKPVARRGYSTPGFYGDN